ncbi:MAG: lytic transglycosylase domain-containing protein [Acidobacteria bacterium]|nr:lytic transglycosylase domain-containing protein [Acidobacteriota bacterium]
MHHQDPQILEGSSILPPPRRSRTLPLVSLIIAGLGVAAASALRADLVILSDGGVLKVKAYELVDADHARLTLLSGGRMTLALTRVDRVVDDEVAPDPEPPATAPGRPAGGAGGPLKAALLPLRFDSKQAVPDGPWGALVYEAARRNSVNPWVIAAVIRAESGGNPYAVSRVGARGLMQLMPATAERFGIRHQQLFDPAQNLEAGSRYLSWLVDQFPDDLAKVLAAYNAGENAVRNYGGVPPYRETRGYVRTIFASLGLATGPALGGGSERPGTPATPATSSQAGTTAVAANRSRGRN